MATRRRTKRKRNGKSPTKRMSAALTRWLRKQNPAFKTAVGVRVKKNRKTGTITITPVKAK